MTSTNWETKKIPIKHLVLWDENSRIPDYSRDENEGELLQELLKKYNLGFLAYEIIKDFDLPQLEKLVVWKTRGKNIVLEGNRRVAAYKCLINPNLVEYEHLRAKFEALKNRRQINDTLRLESVVTSNKEEGMRFVERKHYHGNNEISWNQYERDHHIRRARGEFKTGLSAKERKSVFRTRLGEKVKLLDIPNKIKQEILGRGYATTFYRVVDNEQARKKLKYEKDDYDLFVDNENEKEFLSLLKVIVYNLYCKKTLDGAKFLNSRTLNKDSDIQEYLDYISADDAKEVDKLTKAERNKVPATKKPIKGIVGKAKRTKEEKYSSLICPRETLPEIKSDKIKEVFRELKEVDVAKCPTACTLLVRTLIEITINEYLKKKGDARKDGEALIKRINHVKDKYIKEQDLKDVVDLLNDDLLTKTLNKVVHNTIFSATETKIKDLWKNLSKFFNFLVNDPKMKR